MVANPGVVCHPEFDDGRRSKRVFHEGPLILRLQPRSSRRTTTGTPTAQTGCGSAACDEIDHRRIATDSAVTGHRHDAVTAVSPPRVCPRTLTSRRSAGNHRQGRRGIMRAVGRRGRLDGRGFRAGGSGPLGGDPADGTHPLEWSSLSPDLQVNVCLRAPTASRSRSNEPTAKRLAGRPDNRRGVLGSRVRVPVRQGETSPARDTLVHNPSCTARGEAVEKVVKRIRAALQSRPAVATHSASRHSESHADLTHT